MRSILQKFISYEIQNFLKEDSRSDLISKLRREAIENGNMFWFVKKFDYGLPNATWKNPVWGDNYDKYFDIKRR